MQNKAKMERIVNEKPLTFTENMELYFKDTPPDCTLFCQNNFVIQVHKEVLYQTSLLRNMIENVSDCSCCSKIEILCPSLVKEELEMIVQFLYSGMISCKNQNTALSISNDLMGLFGFPPIDGWKSKKQSSSMPKNQPLVSRSYQLTKKQEILMKEENDMSEDDIVSSIFRYLIFATT